MQVALEDYVRVRQDFLLLFVHVCGPVMSRLVPKALKHTQHNRCPL